MTLAQASAVHVAVRACPNERTLITTFAAHGLVPRLEEIQIVVRPSRA